MAQGSCCCAAASASKCRDARHRAAPALAGETLIRFISGRVHGPAFPQTAVQAIAEVLMRVDLCNRPAAGQACRYLRDRAAYEGAAFTLSAAVLQQAIDFAKRAQAPRSQMRAA